MRRGGGSRTCTIFRTGSDWTSNAGFSKSKPPRTLPRSRSVAPFGKSKTRNVLTSSYRTTSAIWISTVASWAIRFIASTTGAEDTRPAAPDRRPRAKAAQRAAARISAETKNATKRPAVVRIESSRAILFQTGEERNRLVLPGGAPGGEPRRLAGRKGPSAAHTHPRAAGRNARRRVREALHRRKNLARFEGCRPQRRARDFRKARAHQRRRGSRSSWIRNRSVTRCAMGPGPRAHPPIERPGIRSRRQYPARRD